MADRVAGMPAGKRLFTSLLTIWYCVLTCRSGDAEFAQRSLAAGTVTYHIR